MEILKVSASASDTAFSFIDYGSRLFYGYNDSLNAPACIECHNDKERDTLNWNPSLFDIAGKTKLYSPEEFDELLNDPFGSDRLMEAHQGYHFSDSKLVALKAFIESQSQNEIKEIYKVSVRYLAIILLLCLILISLSDLLFFNRVKNRGIHLSLIVCSIITICILISKDIKLLGLQEDYEPDQPIKFSHKTHAGENEINCYYCHSGARHAAVAGIPAINQCMNCHTIIREGSKSGSTELNKLFEANDNKKPVHWVKLNNLPAHTVFDHSQHTKDDYITCEQCHGKVENTDRIYQINGLSMKWCLDCHRSTNVNSAFSGYYKKLYPLYDSLITEDAGGWECIKCHR